jgi:hypothetical protein
VKEEEEDEKFPERNNETIFSRDKRKHETRVEGAMMKEFS